MDTQGNTEPTGTNNPYAPTTAQKRLKTVCLVLVWVCLGLYLEITGPTLIDLKIRTQADYEEVATAVSGRSAGYFIGSAIGGVLVDRFCNHCELMIAVCLTGGAVSTVFVPWSSIIELLWFIIVVQGTFEGVINIAGQKLIINMWQEGAASPLHILHGGFGIGSFIIPLIANPFLAIPKPRGTKVSNTSYNNASYLDAMNSSVLVSSTAATTTSNVKSSWNVSEFNDTDISDQVEYLRESRIEYPYLISAIITLAISSVFYIYHFKGRDFRRAEDLIVKNRREPAKKRSAKDMINPATCADGKLFYGIQILFLLFLYFFNILGGERILGKFVRAYSIEQLNFSVSEGSYINTAFWISFSVGRITGFFTARWIPIRILILIETGGVLVCSVLLNIFAADNATALWVIICALGVFHAPCFPSGIGWGNFHVEMTGMAITFLLLGGSIGGIAYLRLTGYLFETYGARAFLYHVMGYGIAAFSLAVGMDLVGAQYGSRYKKEANDGLGKEDEMREMKKKPIQ